MGAGWEKAGWDSQPYKVSAQPQHPTPRVGGGADMLCLQPDTSLGIFPGTSNHGRTPTPQLPRAEQWHILEMEEELEVWFTPSRRGPRQQCTGLVPAPACIPRPGGTAHAHPPRPAIWGWAHAWHCLGCSQRLRGRAPSFPKGSSNPAKHF